jgi:hypothetical protein
MTTTTIIPAADVLPLPAPAPLLQFLLHLTFLLHLLAMNAMLGGLLLTLWARLRAGGGDSPLRSMADAMSRVTPSLVAGTVTLGVAPLLFVQVLFGQFLFTSSILMAWGWFSVVVVLIVAYYGTYLQAYRQDALGAARVPLLALTVLGFLWIGFMFSNNMTLMLRVEQWAAMHFADPGGTWLNTGDPTLWPRWLHMVVGAPAVAGLMLAWWGRARLGRGDTSGAFMIRKGVQAFCWLTGANVLVGLWYLLSLDRPVVRLFMGGAPLATGAFAAGFVLALVLLLLGWRALRSGTAAGLLPLSLVTLVVMVAMIVMRDAVRGGSLGVHFDAGSFPVQTQVLNLSLFAVLLVGGAVTLVWMIRRLHQAWDR